MKKHGNEKQHPEVGTREAGRAAQHAIVQALDGVVTVSSIVFFSRQAGKQARAYQYINQNKLLLQQRTPHRPAGAHIKTSENRPHERAPRVCPKYKEASCARRCCARNPRACVHQREMIRSKPFALRRYDTSGPSFYRHFNARMYTYTPSECFFKKPDNKNRKKAPNRCCAEHFILTSPGHGTDTLRTTLDLPGFPRRSQWPADGEGRDNTASPLRETAASTADGRSRVENTVANHTKKRRLPTE